MTLNFLTKLIGLPRVCFIPSAGEMFSVIPEKKKNIKNTERQTSGRLTTGNQRKQLVLAVSLGELNRKAAILIFCYIYYIPLTVTAFQ